MDFLQELLAPLPERGGEVVVELEAELLWAVADALPDLLVLDAIYAARRIRSDSLRMAAMEALGRRLDDAARSRLQRSRLFLSFPFLERQAVLGPPITPTTPTDLRSLQVIGITVEQVRARYQRLSKEAQEEVARALIRDLQAPATGAARTEPKRARPHRTRAFEEEGRVFPTGPIRSTDGETAGLEREGEEAPKERVVNTGFAPPESTGRDDDVAKNMPLAAGSDYVFWLEIGPPLPSSMETTPTALGREEVPPHADLAVVLFAYPRELELTPGADMGYLRLQNGTAVVLRQPGAVGPPVDPEETRLRFPVRTPDREGIFRLRCHIYRHQLLVQSRVVSAMVMAEPTALGAAVRAIRSDIDYTLAPSMTSRHLAGVEPHRLSMLLNESGDGTNTFRVYGANGKDAVKSDPTFQRDELTFHIGEIRGALRKAAWDSEEEWQKDIPYRYERAATTSQLFTDLIRLAQRGWRFYDAIAGRLSGKKDQRALAELMRTPGFVQIAIKSASYVLPAAAIYDRPVGKVRSESEFQLCDEFTRALRGPDTLEQGACFVGGCPHRKDKFVICPSGFWGYRHDLGLPVTVGNAPDSPTTIEYEAKPDFAVGISTTFRQWRDHERKMQALDTPIRWVTADSRDQTFEVLKRGGAQVVYFYCHGGLEAGNIPYIRVGDENELPIERADLRAEDVLWTKPRPLVFINGCHTTALTPEIAIDLVSGFVETSHAAGVIGTEITIFEPLATRFAQECFQRFLKGIPIGRAIRAARLALLKDRNPLGLVYVPFVVADLRLVEAR